MPFEIVRNDITRMETDAIVNAANSRLLGGGGVDGAIHAAAGPELLEECRRIGGCPTGEARITKGYRLPARYVIHTVGPVWQGGGRGERALLASCYAASLDLAREYGCRSVAFPMISAGAYGYPREEAMAVAVEEISRFLLKNEMTVYLVVFGRETLTAGKKLFKDIQSYIDDTYVSEHLDLNLEGRRKLSRLEADMRPTVFPVFGQAKGTAERKSFESLQEDDLTVEACLAPDWEGMLRNTDEGFSGTLLRLIDERGMTDAECYKRANMDRKLFSKIRSNPAYHPSKPTVLAFAVALELELAEARDLLEKAGFALSHSSKFDIVLEYFLKNKIYDIYEINQVLFDFDLPLLGNGGAA